MIVKNKYAKSEVLEILEEQRKTFEAELSERRAAAAELKEEISRLSTELVAYKNRDSLIGITLKAAEEKAEDIRREAELKYIAETERLKNFKEKWNKYFGYLAETYPLYPAAEEARKIAARLDAILGKPSDAAEKIYELDDLPELNGKVKFNPKEKIEQYIAGTDSENGFDIEQVLNPGELDLEDLCKELGLMEND